MLLLNFNLYYEKYSSRFWWNRLFHFFFSNFIFSMEWNVVIVFGFVPKAQTIYSSPLCFHCLPKKEEEENIRRITSIMDNGSIRSVARYHLGAIRWCTMHTTNNNNEKYAKEWNNAFCFFGLALPQCTVYSYTFMKLNIYG